jgi:hypothetical protein
VFMSGNGLGEQAIFAAAIGPIKDQLAQGR